jgi:hypothetical protein
VATFLAGFINSNDPVACEPFQPISKLARDLEPSLLPLRQVVQPGRRVGYLEYAGNLRGIRGLNEFAALFMDATVLTF